MLRYAVGGSCWPSINSSIRKAGQNATTNAYSTPMGAVWVLRSEGRGHGVRVSKGAGSEDMRSYMAEDVGAMRDGSWSRPHEEARAWH